MLLLVLNQIIQMINCGVGTGLIVPQNEWHWLLQTLQIPLRKKYPSSHKTYETKSSFSFLIPDSIIYQAGRPCRWYFSSKDSSVLRKKSDKLENKRIYEALAERGNLHKGPAACNQIKYEGWADQDQIRVTFKFISYSELKHAVFSQESRHAMDVLSSYVTSHQELPNTYCVQWTPSISTIEKIVNVSKKAKISFERISTFEGPTSLCLTQSTVSPKITEQINRALLEITTQIMAVRNVSLRGIKLYFRFDHKHRPVLMFASHIRSDGIIDEPDLPFRPAVAQNRSVSIFLDPEQFSPKKSADSVVTEVVLSQQKPSRFSLIQKGGNPASRMETLDVSMSTIQNQPSIASSSSTPLSLARYSKVRPQIGRSRPVSAKTKMSYTSISSFGNCPICGGQFQQRGSFELPVSTLIRLAEYQVALQTRKKMQLQLRSSLTIEDDASTVVTSNSSKKLIDVYLGASHDGVPLTLMRAFPGLNCRSYVAKKNNPIWLYSLVKVCYDCWIEVKPRQERNICRIYQNCKDYEKESSTYSTDHMRRTSITSNVSSSRPYFAKGGQVKRVPLVMRSGEFSHTGFSEHSIHEESKEQDTHETVTPLEESGSPAASAHPYLEKPSSSISRRPRPLSGKSSFSTSRNQYSQNPSVKELRRLAMGSSKSLGVASKIKYNKPPQAPRFKASPYPTPKGSFSTYKPSLASLDTTTNERSTLHTQQSSLLQNFDPNDMEKIAKNADNLIEIISRIKQQSLKEEGRSQKRRSIAWE